MDTLNFIFLLFVSTSLVLSVSPFPGTFRNWLRSHRLIRYLLLIVLLFISTQLAAQSTAESVSNQKLTNSRSNVSPPGDAAYWLP